MSEIARVKRFARSLTLGIVFLLMAVLVMGVLPSRASTPKVRQAEVAATADCDNATDATAAEGCAAAATTPSLLGRFVRHSEETILVVLGLLFVGLLAVQYSLRNRQFV